MKSISKLPLLFAIVCALLVLARANNISQVQHVVVVIQENRTPTNLFQLDQTLINNGAHIVSVSQAKDKCSGNYITLQPANLFTCWDTQHSHQPDWNNMWDKGAMDGACQIQLALNPKIGTWCGQTPPACYISGTNQVCSYSYVANTKPPGGPGILDPLFQIANQYGFANYMFQTNQGPSFAAHQFLLAGTSAPDKFNNDECDYDVNHQYKCYQWFSAENQNAQGGYGCTSTNANIEEVDPDRAEAYGIYNNGYPCYDHTTLVDLLDNAQPSSITWKYYARAAADLWTAPNAIKAICQPSPTTMPGDECTGQDWINNVQAVLPNQGNYPNDHAPFLTDVNNCKLAAVSWVIPDGNWSDHAGGNPAVVNGDGGPSWLAAIVNAIGGSSCTDMVNGQNVTYWKDTVILVTWDDWGGYYDDVVPPDCQTSPCAGYFGGNGNGKQYVYGFRVPLLVVGAYVRPGYISGGGPNNYPPDCQHNTYCHDFGSILNFIEYVFGSGGSPLGGPGGISPSYNYADVLVMDRQQSPPNNYSLYDFFDFTTFHQFQTINGAKYPASCFHNPTGPNCFKTYPIDPDSDANESD